MLASGSIRFQLFRQRLTSPQCSLFQHDRDCTAVKPPDQSRYQKPRPQRRRANVSQRVSTNVQCSFQLAPSSSRAAVQGRSWPSVCQIPNADTNARKLSTDTVVSVQKVRRIVKVSQASPRAGGVKERRRSLSVDRRTEVPPCAIFSLWCGNVKYEWSALTPNQINVLHPAPAVPICVCFWYAGDR